MTSTTTAPQTVADTLRAARALIADPAHWIQSDYARSINNRYCSPRHPNAARWCAVGALARIDGPQYGPAYNVLLDVTKGITFFNDSHSHADVLAAFDQAIALAEGSTP